MAKKTKIVTNRYPWPRATELDGAFELKARDIIQTLDQDYPHLRCWIHSCKEKLLSGQDVYRPTKNYNSQTNKIIAHVDCIDNYLAAQKTKDRQKAIERAEKSGVILPVGPPPVETPKEKPIDSRVLTSLKGEAGATSKGSLDVKEAFKLRLKQEYDAGYAAGKQAALAELLNELSH